MAANMDTVGTPAMYKALVEYDMITCPAKHHLKEPKDIMNFRGKNVCMFGGLEDIGTLTLNQVKFDMLGIDVANGYTISVVEAVKDLSKQVEELKNASSN